ncbi:RDD family protein [Leptobacterium flavescens]|uniref:RDD family protein n=1 Tax=Leptobacterium flavescens TaxID=472055 RepID=A0A6P0UF30_9FLAO|nr:RDD family protein [Leptobacterium flavescens]NER11874.1 RDD family protein [Leptobacterium flavescens]
MKENYAQLPDRVKAAVIDGIVLIALMYATTEVLALFNDVPQFIRIIAFVLIFVLYDPILTSAFGGTIGHSYSNILVKREGDSKRNLPFHFALIRFILKAALGWISLLTVTGNEKKKAIHDFAANSIVIEEKKGE